MFHQIESYVHTRLDDEFTVDSLLLDEGLQCMEIGEFETPDGGIFGVGEEKRLTMPSVLLPISSCRLVWKGSTWHVPVPSLPSTPHALPTGQL